MVKTQLDAISVGGITIDHIFKINELPAKNMASLILEHGIFYGGRAPNVAVVLAKLGFKTAIISTAGNDFQKIGYAEYLKNLQINTTGIANNKKTKTTEVYIFVDDAGHNHTYVNLGSEKISQFLIKSYEVKWKEIIKQTKIIHASSGNPILNKKIFEIRRTLNQYIPVSFDIGNDIFFHDKKYVMRIINETAFLFMNDFEFEHLNKMLTLHKPTNIFELSQNVDVLSIIYKNRSIKLYTKDGNYFYMPPMKNILVDFTGTSDAYVSGFIAGHLKGLDYVESMAIGQILMGYIGSKLGAQSCVPQWKNLQELLEKYKKNVKW